MPSVGGIVGRLKRFKPCESAMKSAWCLHVYSLPTSCWSSVALSWPDPFPEHYGWYFPYLWSVSKGSWLLQLHLLNNSGQNIKRTEFFIPGMWQEWWYNRWWYLLQQRWNHFPLRKGWTQWDNRLTQRWKNLEIFVGSSSTTLLRFTSAFLYAPFKMFQCF